MFLNDMDFLFEDEKIVSRFIFFSETDFVFNSEQVSTYDSMDGLDRVLGKAVADGLNLKADVFPVAEELSEMNQET